MARSLPARNSRGRFVKGARRSSSSKALVVRRSTSLSRRRGGGPVVVYAKASPRKGRRRRGGGGGGRVGMLGPVERGGIGDRIKRRLPAGAASAVYAYATRGKSARAKELQTYVKKIPVLDTIGAPATHAILFTAIACNTSGPLSQIADLLGQAAFHQAFANLGASDFDHEVAAKLGGVDDVDGVQMGGMNG